MSSIGPCPDAEALSALIDGSVSPETRREVLLHIDGCELCGEVFYEALHVLEEAVSESEPAVQPKLAPFKLKKNLHALYGAIAAAAVLFLAVSLGPFERSKSQPAFLNAAFWAELPRVESSPSVVKAEAVLARLAAAADLGFQPELQVRDAGGLPFAFALENHQILLTRKALEDCLGPEDNPLPGGESRLAFVLGHELAHLKKEAHFHAFAARELMAGKPIAMGGGAEKHSAASREEEMEADRQGLLFASLAGYYPEWERANNEAFFQSWSGEPVHKATYGGHPDPAKRADAYARHLAGLARELDLFRFGVRCFETGLLDISQDLFKAFYRIFPAREVANNLGLVHFQKARRLRFASGAFGSPRFRLPIVLDQQTRAKAGATRGGPANPVDDQFQTQVNLAKDLFQEAIRKDPEYTPARLNLIATLLLQGDHAAALNLSQELKDAGWQNGRLDHLYYLTRYLYGDTEGALTGLKQLDWRTDADLAYNLAQILTLRDAREATPVWQAFLEREPRGSYAREARLNLRLPNPEIELNAPEAPQPPIALGPVGEASRGILAEMDVQVLKTDELSLYRGSNLRVLVFENQIFMVENLSPEPTKVEQILSANGKPVGQKILGGSVIMFYPGLVFELDKAMVRRVWFF